MTLRQILAAHALGSATTREGPCAGSAGKRGNVLFWVAVGLLAALGLGLRAGYLSQSYFQYDEGIATAVAGGLDFPGHWSTNWANYPVPPEFHADQFNFSSYHYLGHAWLCAVERMVSPEHRLTILRSLNLPLALAALLFTALAVRRILGWLPGAFAAAVVAVLPILVQDSHYARCETMLTAGVALLLWLLVPGARRTGWNWTLIGAIAGWLVASKFSLVLVGPLLLGAVAADHLGRASAWADAGRACGCLLVGGGLGLAIGMPGAIAAPPAFWRGLRALLSQYDGFYPPYSLPDHGPVMGVLVSYLIAIIGPGLLGLAGVGAVSASCRAPRIWVGGLLAALILPVVVFGTKSFFAERNLSPFLPLLALLAASGWALILALARAVPGVAGRVAPWLAGVALLMTLVPPARLSWRLVTRGFSLKEHREQVAYLDRVAAAAVQQNYGYYSGWIPEAADLAKAEAVARSGPTIFAIYDLQDANSKENISRLMREHSGRIVAVREGLFPGLPCCTLTTMISARILIIECRPSR